jgi:hypothetical protein
MTPDQRQQTVDFLRQLAAWLEDGEELEQQYGGQWTPIVPSFFDGVMAWKDSVRVKPKPLERWLVELTYCGVWCNTREEADELARIHATEHVRTVHLREVQ